MPRRFHTLDVFTRTALSGNPLAVVTDSDGLDAERMQAIAREFNLSETVFVCEPRNPMNAARLRIFTPFAELPFAGHPTIGAAALIAELRAPDLLARQDVGVVLEEAIGDVACTAWRAGSGGLHASFILPKLPWKSGEPPSDVDLARALSLAPQDIGFDDHRPSMWSAGTEFILAPVASREAAERARPSPEAWERLGAKERRKVFVYCKQTSDESRHVHARMFAPDLGVPEDPATGSAAAAFAGAATEAERPEDGEHVVVIEQGEEMGRPSLITLTLSIESGRLVGAAVSGGVARVADGALRL